MGSLRDGLGGDLRAPPASQFQQGKSQRLPQAPISALCYHTPGTTRDRDREHEGLPASEFISQLLCVAACMGVLGGCVCETLKSRSVVFLNLSPTVYSCCF